MADFMGKGEPVTVEIVSVHVLVNIDVFQVTGSEALHLKFPLQCQDGNDVDVELEFDNFFDGDWNDGGRVVGEQKIIGFLAQIIITVDGDFEAAVISAILYLA